MRKLVNESIDDVLQGPSEEEINLRLKVYNEAEYKMDKFMSDDEEDMIEYYDILDSDENEQSKIDDMNSFLEYSVIDEDRMYSYFPEGGNITEFATYLVRNAG